MYINLLRSFIEYKLYKYNYKSYLYFKIKGEEFEEMVSSHIKVEDMEQLGFLF